MPTKALPDRRTHQVKVLFNDDEYQQLLDHCQSSGRLPGTYCRLKALEQESQVKTIPADLKHCDRQLGQLGGNLNQIAHHLNLGNVMDSVDAVSLQVSIQQLHTLITTTQTLIRSVTQR